MRLYKRLNIQTGIATTILLITTTSANAGWWDCDLPVYKKGFFGWSYQSDVEAEVEGDNRSSAALAAASIVGKGGYYFVPGFVGKSAYVCSVGNDSNEKGEVCEYKFDRVSECRRQ